MFVLEFFTVYPDSVSERIIQKNCLTNIILALSLLPRSVTIFFCHQRIGCHGELVTSQIKIESQNFRCYNQPNIVSRFNSHTIQLEPCSKTSWLCLYQFTMLNRGLPVPDRRPNTVTRTWNLASLILWFLSAITVWQSLMMMFAYFDISKVTRVTGWFLSYATTDKVSIESLKLTQII